MYRPFAILFLFSLSACAGSSVWPDGGMEPGVDSGGLGGADAGTLRPDASTARDAGSVVAVGDTGPSLVCTLEPVAQAIRLTGYGQQYELGDLAESGGKLAFSYTWNQKERRVWLGEARTGALSFDGKLAFLEGAPPHFLDLADGLLFAAGVASSATGPAATRFGFFDAKEVTGKGQLEETVVAAAREKAGARMVVQGALGTDLSESVPLLLVRVGLDGQVLEKQELARSTRWRSEWDLGFRYDAEAGVLCGAVQKADQEVLALFPMSTASPAAVETSQPLAAPSKAERAQFGCRLALGPELVAVAFSEGDGGARLVWLDTEGRTRAGPVPFLASYRDAGRYDVAAHGEVTALAWLDDTNPNSPRVAVRVFPSPAAAPLALTADVGLELGLFELKGRRVRLVSTEKGFLVAFDVGVKAGQTDLYVRRIVCE